MPLLVNRFHKHALRPAEGANSPETAFADPVVNSPTRYAEKLSSLVDRDASTELGLEGRVVLGKNRGVHENNLRRCNGTASATAR